eukprot:TRINITY_DN38407_c0_g1_i1.p1 TRINITY_DN38407_c0_g1~~TRINITY_DN38407_c0_g1_i1.p1  ORF type:complete len:733 (+),score=147.96 TRINITY_DN38407_c0_g1_i1:42-2201(+)
MGNTVCSDRLLQESSSVEVVNDVGADSVEDEVFCNSGGAESSSAPSAEAKSLQETLATAALVQELEAVLEEPETATGSVEEEMPKVGRSFSAPGELGGEARQRWPIESAILQRCFSDPTAGWLQRPQGYELLDRDSRDSGRPIRFCCRCRAAGVDLFADPADGERYCGMCWTEFYGEPPEVLPLVRIDALEVLSKDHLALLWDGAEIPGWPPAPGEESLGSPLPAPPAKVAAKDEWRNVQVCVRPGLVGDTARALIQSEKGMEGETLAGRYQVDSTLGAGNFTKAYLAKDLKKREMVCLKCYHRRCSMEELVDLMVLSKRLQAVDPGMETFPHVRDAFFDIAGFTVESLISGQNCFGIASENPFFFTELQNLAHVARGVLSGLTLLEKAGIVHNDLKPDNILWIGSPSSGDGSPKHRRRPDSTPSVRIVDFGCARLDQRERPSENWNLAEGGAGHLGYASPEMNLGIPVTHLSDVWSLGVLLCELHCGRGIWFSDTLTPEEVMTQALGLAGMREGVPSSLLKRAPVDVRRFYTPAFSFSRGHMPVLRLPDGTVEILSPQEFGLEQVLGDLWREEGKAELRELLAACLQLDHLTRLRAAELLQLSFVAASGQQPAPAAPRKWSPSFCWGLGRRVPKAQPKKHMDSGAPGRPGPRPAAAPMPAAGRQTWASPNHFPESSRAAAVAPAGREKPRRPSEMSKTSDHSKEVSERARQLQSLQVA